ncbi:MICOS complex subunit mic19 [Seiridium cupressi]
MGASSSKPAGGQASYVWKASGPVGVSQDVVESLQGSTETDTSRAQTLELAVQARVAEELKKLSSQESAALSAAQKKASEITDADSQKDAGPSHQSVSKEVEALRTRLEKRKQLRDLPESVEKSRSEVVQCLIANDRRPLNCWKEVESFKEEVRRLEKEWVERVVR